MQFSFSRCETFRKCAYQYKLRYLDNVKTIPDTDPTNALYLGTGVHTAIEKGADVGIKEYFKQYPIISDLHINEAIKIESLTPKVQKLVRSLNAKNYAFEVQISTDSFIGFIDLLVEFENGEYGIYDFKYTNNKEHYMKSGQLHVYKYFFEQLNPTKHVSKLGFIFIPKTAIRQKKTEDLCQFRTRLDETLADLEPSIQEVRNDPTKVMEYLNSVVEAKEAKEFPKNPSRLCDYCPYQDYCEKGDTLMILPENKRRTIDQASRKKVWLYGAPFSGKTTIADSFPDPIMLNTDGNLNSFTAPYIEIKETLEGRTPIKPWDNLKGAIDALQKGSDYKTIVVDLVEDCYEHCRRWCYEKYGFNHESDAGFGKGYDIIRNEFLTVFKKLLTLNYNIVLISHEDTSKDITRKSGDKITSIKPNINDKIANKLAGMVDIVARVVADGDSRTLQFKSDDVVFGGGRLKLAHTVIPCTYEALDEVYKGKDVGADEAPRRSRRIEE